MNEPVRFEHLETERATETLFSENRRMRAALERIADEASARDQGLARPYVDWELRTIARDALKRVERSQRR